MKFLGVKALKKSYRLIPLLTPVIFRETVPLNVRGVEQHNFQITFVRHLKSTLVGKNEEKHRDYW